MARDKEKKREYDRRWKLANKERLAVVREENKHVKKEKDHEWYLENRDRVLAEQKRKYIEQRDVFLARGKGYRQRRQAPILEAKQKGTCFECGESRWYCLEFHHLDPKTKIFNLTVVAGRQRTPSEIEEEIKKTVFLCANCHAEIHYLDRELMKSLKGQR